MNSPPEIAKEYLEFAKKQVRLTLPKLIILSIYAGFFISSGAICSLACSYRLTGGDGRFYAGLVGPIGLMLCLCAGAELFTANCLLLIVYGHVTHLFDYALASYLVTEGIEKTSLSFGDAFVKGILGNFCLCLSIWLSFGAKDLFSKIAALWTPFALLRACGYEHIVSNMFYIPAALMAASEYNLVKDNLSWGRYFYKNLIPVLLGNIIGGAVLMGFGYWYIYLTPDTCCSKNNNINNDNVNNKDIPTYNINNQNEIPPNQNQINNINNQNMISNAQDGN